MNELGLLGVALAGAVLATLTARLCASAPSPALWAAAPAGGLLAVAGATSSVPVAAAIAGGGLAAAAVVDAVELRIPTSLAYAVAGASGFALVVSAFFSSSSPWSLLGRAALATGVVVALFLVLWAFGGMGFGDVRLALAATPTAAVAGGSAVAGVAALLWGAFAAAGFMLVPIALASRRRARVAPAAPVGVVPAVVGAPVPAGAPVVVPSAAAPSAAGAPAPAGAPAADAGPAGRRPALHIPFGPAIAAGWLLAVVAT